MKVTAAQKIKIGIFTLAGIGILILAVFMIGKRKNMFGDTFAIYGIFKNVGGLQVGNNVRFAGINVGTVENIAILSDTAVRVDMLIQNKVNPYLKADAVASIGSDGLMGDKLITIAAGISPERLTQKGGAIATTNPVDYDKIIAKITKVADNAEQITGALAGIVNEVSKGKGTVGALLYNDTLAKSMEGTISAAHQTMNSIKQGSKGFSENMQALHHNFLLRGYFKRKARKEERKKEKMEHKKEKKDEKQGQ